MADRNPPQLTSFLEQWKKLHIAVTEMGPYARTIRKVEDILEEDTDSKAEFKQMKEEVKRLNCVLNEMTGTFGQQVVALQKEHKTRLHEMNARANEAEEKAGFHRTKSKESSQKCLALEEELESQRKLLSAKKEERESLWLALGLVELDDLLLDKLAMRIHAFAESTFLNDSENLALGENQNKTFQRLVGSGFIDREKPIPISTSTASKYLRMATIEALVAKELSTSVFRADPGYTTWLNPISPSPDWNTIAKDQPLQEAVLRSVSAAVYSRERQDVEENEIASITHTISRKSRPLIVDIASFETELQCLLRDAFDIWRATQRSLRRVRAVKDGKACVDFPAFDIDEGVSFSEDINTESTPMVIFPTILFAATSEVLHSGYILRPSHALFLAGVIEVEHQIEEVRRG